MKRLPLLIILVLVAISLVWFSTRSGPRRHDVSIQGLPASAVAEVLAGGPNAHALRLNHQSVDLLWGITGTQEQNCGGRKVAGGEVGGRGELTQLGNSSLRMSAAWDIGNLLQGAHRFTPAGPASGPVAPVLGRGDYPYAFHFDPARRTCGTGPTATGKIVLETMNGDRVYGDVLGGEAFKLRFIVDGDGVETFANIEVTGGTGRFAGATGSFVIHDIARLQPTLTFALTLVEVLPGGTLAH